MRENAAGVSTSATPLNHKLFGRSHHAMDDADDVWDQVATALESFIEAWEKDEATPPCPTRFAPHEPKETRRLALIELVKLDLEYRWQGSSQRRHLEDYAAEIDELQETDRLPVDLIYEEYNVRRRCGEAFQLTEYFQRFPRQAEQLRRLIDLGAAETTTSFALATRPKGLQVGDSIDDFDLLAELGAGAFASVFLARQRTLQRVVALKVSRNQGQEPQTLAQLDHPHIGRVYDQRILAEQEFDCCT